MEKLADISMFENMQAHANQQMVFDAAGDNLLTPMGVFTPVENDGLDVSSNPDGSISKGAVQPVQPSAKDREPVPEWGKNMDKRIGTLEQQMSVTQQAVRETQQAVQSGFDAISKRFDRLENR